MSAICIERGFPALRQLEDHAEVVVAGNLRGGGGGEEQLACRK